MMRKLLDTRVLDGQVVTLILSDLDKAMTPGASSPSTEIPA